MARPRGFHRRDHLLALFWPEKDERHARNALSQAIHFLRQALGEEVILCRGADDVGVDSERLAVDVLEFEAQVREGDAAAALRLYRGELLDGFHVPDLADVERWLSDERLRLHHLALQAALQAADAAAGAGDLAGAVALSERAVRIRPANDAAVRALMTFLHRSGNRAGALESYGRLERDLREEYGAEPEQDTLELAELIRSGAGDGAAVGHAPRVSDSGVESAPHASSNGVATSRAAVGLPHVEKGRAWTTVASWLWGSAAVALALWLALGREFPRAADGRPIRMTIPLSEGDHIALEGRVGAAEPTPMALSPDGSRMAYSAAVDGDARLVLRDLDGFASRELAGTEGAMAPFFSPDGRWVGFAADGVLKRVSVDGGPVQSIAPAPFILGAAWTDADSVVFAPGVGAGLSIVSASGGEPTPVTSLGRMGREFAHIWPTMLPDGRSLLFDRWSAPEKHEIVWLSLPDRTQRIVLTNAGHPHYLPSGHLVFERAGHLEVQPFDPGRATLSGSPVPFLDAYEGFFSASTTRMVYVPKADDTPSRSIVRVDRGGNATALAEFEGTVLEPQLSPDGRRVLVVVLADGGAAVYSYDLVSAKLERLAEGYWPVWSPDGQWVAFSDGRAALRRRADGSRQESEYLLAEGWPTSWSVDGTLLLDVEGDIWQLDPQEHGSARPLIATAASEGGARFSPSGRVLAYKSDESGRWEVYVQPYPPSGVRQMVSAGGGWDPVWSGDGRELFYRRGDAEMWSVPISTERGLTVGAPRLLFARRYGTRADRSYAYDPAVDGFILSPPDEVPTEFRLVVNWAAALTEGLSALAH